MIRYRSILLTALTFSLLIASFATYIDQKIQRIENGLMSEVGISEDEFALQLKQELIFDNEESLQSLLTTLSKLGLSYSGTATWKTMIPLYVLRVAPFALFLAIFELFILGVSFTYYFIFFLSPSASVLDSIRRLPFACLQLLCCAFWAFLRSMLWIPFIGPLVALYLIPRFALAPFFVLSGRSRIFESISQSVHRTDRQWLHTVLSILVLFFLSIALFWCVVVLASIPSVFSSKIGYLVFLIGVQCIVAYASAFLLVFSELTS